MMITENPVLTVQKLRVATADGIEVLHGVDLELYRGEILALVGESGSGKQIVGLACLAHFRDGLQYVSGRIMINPVDGTEPFQLLDQDAETLRSLRGRRLAYIPQDPALSLNPAVRVGNQIMEVLTIHGFGSHAERQARVAEVLTDVELPSTEAFQRCWPHELIGEQQLRIAVAMAFVMNPDVVVVEQPTAGLDLTARALLWETIRRMTITHRVASLCITRDLTMVATLADRVAVMDRGHVVETGDWEQILSRPNHPYTQRLIAAIPGLIEDHVLEPATSIPTPAHADDTTHPVLAVENLKVTYGKHTVVHDINLTLAPGECTLVFGEPGSGKTTLARSIAGLGGRYDGAIKLRGATLARSIRKRRLAHRQDLQYIFPSPSASLNPQRTIGQSLSVPLEISSVLPEKQRRAWVEEALEAVQLDASYYDHRPEELTDGERQRAAIARALVNKPAVLICDEITSELDVSEQASIIELLNSLREVHGLSMLFFTDNIMLARQVAATRIAVLNEGEIVDHGTVDEVFENPSHSYTKSLLANIVVL